MKRSISILHTGWLVLIFSRCWSDLSWALSPMDSPPRNWRSPDLPCRAATSIVDTTNSRRAFVANNLAVVVGASVTIPAPAFAAIEDLALPTAKEQKLTEEQAYQERLRRKAELQQQAQGARTYREGLKAEFDKQKQMNSKNQEERRRAMCEELGRGC